MAVDNEEGGEEIRNEEIPDEIPCQRKTQGGVNDNSK
jgi:hypothetical protein